MTGGQTTGRGTFVPLHFAPGDAFQFDWSEDFAVLGGERTKLQMAHIKLAHSLVAPETIPEFLESAQDDDLEEWENTENLHPGQA